MQAFLFFLALSAIAVYIFWDTIRKKLFPKKNTSLTIDDQYNAERKQREEEIDRLLGKMGKNGVEDLSKKDRDLLDELSKK